MPVDCEVFQGSATITIEHLTGEIKPLEARVGDRVPGGARNLDGRIIIKVCLVVYLIFYSSVMDVVEHMINFLCLLYL